MSTSQNTSSKHNNGRPDTIKTHTPYRGLYIRAFASLFELVRFRKREERREEVGDVLREMHRFFNDSF